MKFVQISELPREIHHGRNLKKALLHWALAPKSSSCTGQLSMCTWSPCACINYHRKIACVTPDATAERKVPLVPRGSRLRHEQFVRGNQRTTGQPGQGSKKFASFLMVPHSLAAQRKNCARNPEFESSIFDCFCRK